jgi:hypothetical protein
MRELNFLYDDDDLDAAIKYASDIENKYNDAEIVDILLAGLKQ